MTIWLNADFNEIDWFNKLSNADPNILLFLDYVLGHGSYNVKYMVKPSNITIKNCCFLW